MQDIKIFSHNDFDQFCEQNGINDDNVEGMKDFAFISIIGTPEVNEYYLQEPHESHWFKNNHPNVLNIEFDDVSKDRVFNYKNGENEDIEIHSYVITEAQAMQIVDFIEANMGRTFVIHCKAGFSRSPAVGRFILNYFEDYSGCKGKTYIDRVRPNVEVLSKLNNAWRKKHNYSYFAETMEKE